MIRCSECGKPLASFSSQGICLDCMYKHFIKAKVSNSFIREDSFKFMLLPLILTVASLGLFYLFGLIGQVFQTIAFFIFMGTVGYAISCGVHFTDRFKTYVGEPDSYMVTATISESGIDNKYWVNMRGESVYSGNQIMQMIINVLLTLLGAVLVYLIGWICFIVTCIRYSDKSVEKQREKFMAEVKEEYKELGFDAHTAISNAKEGVLEVLPIKLNLHGELVKCSILPFKYGEDGDIGYIYAVINVTEDIPSPFAMIYYKRLHVAFPTKIICDILQGDSDDLDGDAKQALLLIPHFSEYLFKYWTRDCDKLLGVKGMYEITHGIDYDFENPPASADTDDASAEDSDDDSEAEDSDDDGSEAEDSDDDGEAGEPG